MGFLNWVDMALITLTAQGLYCPAGGFHIDPWRPVPYAVITHAHADHARPGSEHYLTTPQGKAVLATRMQADAEIETVAYGKPITFGGVRISLHPAGHLLGSAQVRVEHEGEVWVISGDYKRQEDPTCESFEPVKCHTFITESTFGLPVYRWPDAKETAESINAWWRQNAEADRTSLIYAYSLGKAQRILALLDPEAIPGGGPILVHGSIEKMVDAYREAGVVLPPVIHADADAAKRHRGRAVVLAPPSANGTTWVRKFAPFASAFVSGWMRVRGTRRWRAVDRGFVMSDHVDWPGLMQTIEETQAQRIGVTHGYSDAVVKYLQSQGRDAFELKTRFIGELEEDRPDTPETVDNVDATQNGSLQ